MRANVLSHSNKLMKMIDDPCNSDIVAGLHGTSEGICQRFVTNFQPASTETSGYLIWFPSMHCGNPNGSYSSGNRPVGGVIWNASSTTVNPLNTTAAPYGSGIAGTAGSFVDPFFTTLASASVQDGRTLAACMRVKPTNSISGIQGTIAYLDNIPHTFLDSLTTGSAAAPPTVNEMLAYSRKIERMGVETYEVKHRPGMADKFYTESDGVFSYNVGSSGTGPTSVGEANAPKGIGFVWTGIAGANTLLFTMYKICEWRPSPTAGVPLPRPISMPSVSLNSILAELDRRRGDWQQSGAHNPMMNSVINTAWTAAGSLFKGATRPNSMIGRYARGMPLLTYT